MSDLIRSAWLKMILVLALALVGTQCGSDNGGGGDGNGNGDAEPECSVEELTAGTYSFTLNLNNCDDDCDQGHGIAELICDQGEVLPGPYSINLPSYQQLLAGSQPFNATIPFVGPVTGTLTLAGDVVGLSVQQNPITVQDVNIPGIGLVDFTVNAVATFCTASATVVDAEFIATITNTNPSIIAPCPMTFPATGIRQGG